MADYYGHCRSNYFKVKDSKAFDAFCKKWELEILYDKDPELELVGFISNHETGIPYGYADGDDFVDDVDFLKELSEHLEENWVAVVMEVGREKMRYLVGEAYAVNSKGEIERVSLDHIYELAKSKLGKNVTDCAY